MKNPTPFSTKASIGLTKRISAGFLHMGSPFHPREMPRQTIYVAEFEMAHTAVTVSQYAVFIESNPAEQPRWWSQAGWEWLYGKRSGWGRENRFRPDGWENQVRRPVHPVVGITKYEAEAYCAWLSYQKTQKVRLPTEIEWEYAARGEDSRPYPWGDEFDSTLANTLESDRQEAIEAASLPGDISPFGVMDMAGNVQQWTATAYTPLPEEIYPDQELFVVRGGSFNDTAFAARVSYRRAYPPGYFYPFLGFRVVTEPR